MLSPWMSPASQRRFSACPLTGTNAAMEADLEENGIMMDNDEETKTQFFSVYNETELGFV